MTCRSWWRRAIPRSPSCMVRPRQSRRRTSRLTSITSAISIRAVSMQPRHRGQAPTLCSWCRDPLRACCRHARAGRGVGLTYSTDQDKGHRERRSSSALPSSLMPFPESKLRALVHDRIEWHVDKDQLKVMKVAEQSEREALAGCGEDLEGRCGVMENAPHLTQRPITRTRACDRPHSPRTSSWAGWHAPNEVCGDCRFFDRGKEVWGVLKGPCLKRRDLDPKRKKGPPIPSTCRACRFWEGRT